MAFEIQLTVSRSLKAVPPDAELGFGRFFSDHMFTAEWSVGGWLDARILPYAPIAFDPGAAGLHYGQALIDGVKAIRGADNRIRFFRLHDHCARFCRSLERLAFPALAPQSLESVINSLVHIDRRWVPHSVGTALYVRPLILATEPYIGVKESTRHLLLIVASPVAPYFSNELRPIRVWTERQCVRAPRRGLGDVKAGANYPPTLVTARKRRLEGFDQVLWLDAERRKFIQELANMNVFVRLRDEVITPPLNGAILPGITRDSIITLLRRWGWRVLERDLGMDEIVDAYKHGEAMEIFGCGTAAVVAPVGELTVDAVRLDLQPEDQQSLARKLYTEIVSLQRGVAPDQFGWLSQLPAQS